MESQKDSYYINRVKEGDPSAYAFLVDKHKRMAYNVAMQLMGNREDAEEVAQDAFLKAYQALDSYKGEAKFSTWIYRIIYNAAMSRLRKKKLQVSSMDEHQSVVAAVSDTQSALQALKENERKEFVGKALDKMDPEDKMILSLFYLEEKSVEELSVITQWSKSNTKVKLHRARKRLYVQLQKLLHGELRTIL